MITRSMVGDEMNWQVDASQIAPRDAVYRHSDADYCHSIVLLAFGMAYLLTFITGIKLRSNVQ